MRRSTKNYIASAAGVGAVALGLPVLATAPAYATGDHCKTGVVEYSLDGGNTWTTKGRMDEALVTKIQVRLKDEIKNSCQYAVSLASYSAEGPTWSKSGTQAFLGWDTTKLSKENKQATLDVSKYAPECYGQVDLYGNGNKYDGSGQFPLPHYPNAAFPKDLITAWNGGKKCETPPTTPPATTPPATTPPATTTPPTKPPTGTTPPAETSKPPTSASASPSTSTSKPPTSTAPVPTSPDTEAPVGKPEVPPLTDTAPPALADTGGDSNAPVMIGVSAGVLLVGGAGVLVWNRRRNNGGTPA